MENIMMLPASYCVMNEEEMTYTTGGTATETLAVWLWPGYAQYVGVSMCREERQKGNDDWFNATWDRIKKEKGSLYAAGMAVNNLWTSFFTFGLYPLLAVGFICF